MKKYIRFQLSICLLLLIPSLLWAQKGFRVTGIVTDAGGEPVTGVSVVCSANRQGIVTDQEGQYSILADSGEGTLVFSFIGMKTRSVRVQNRSRIDIVMEEDVETLENALVVGAYGTTQRKEDMVGSAFQVNASDLQNKPKARIDAILDGLVPGMSIENVSDSGANTRDRFNVRIRGQSSLYGSSAPL